MRIFGLISDFCHHFFPFALFFFENFIGLLAFFLFYLLSIPLLDLLSISFPPFFFRKILLRLLSFSLFDLLPIFLDHLSPSFRHRLSSPCLAGDFSVQIFLFHPHDGFFNYSLLFSLIIYCLSLNVDYNKNRRWI